MSWHQLQLSICSTGFLQIHEKRAVFFSWQFRDSNSDFTFHELRSYLEPRKHVHLKLKPPILIILKMLGPQSFLSWLLVTLSGLHKSFDWILPFQMMTWPLLCPSLVSRCGHRKGIYTEKLNSSQMGRLK